MKTNDKKSTFLFPVRDAVNADKVTLVPVPRDFHIEVSREINSKRKRLQRCGACCCPRKRLWKCDGDCDRCRYRISDPALLHLDAPVTMDENLSLMDTVVDDTPLPEDVIADKELPVALFKALDKLDERSRRICELMSMVSEREVAKQLGIPRSTLKYQWAKIQAMLQEKLKDYR